MSYMSPQELQFYEVAKTAIIQLRIDHATMYHRKTKISLFIAGLSHSELMVEVGRLLEKNPFGP